jgi:CBS domain-containing membrane protein
MPAAMKKRTPITHIMTPDPYTLGVHEDLETAERRFRELGVRHLPVVRGEKLVGILSLTDLQRISFVDNFDTEGDADTAIYNMLRLDQVMVSKPYTLPVTATIRDAAEVLTEQEFHALPVVDENRKVVGIVTTTDLIRYLLSQF